MDLIDALMRPGDLLGHGGGFVRVSSNPRVLPSPVGVEDARGVLRALRALPGHRFVVDDVSLGAADVPMLAGHRQVADAHLLTLARRRDLRLVTFDGAIRGLGGDGRDVELLARLSAASSPATTGPGRTAPPALDRRRRGHRSSASIWGAAP